MRNETLAFTECGFHAFYAKLEVGEGRERGRVGGRGERTKNETLSFSVNKISNYIRVCMHPTISKLVPHSYFRELIVKNKSYKLAISLLNYVSKVIYSSQDLDSSWPSIEEWIFKIGIQA